MFTLAFHSLASVALLLQLLGRKRRVRRPAALAARNWRRAAACAAGLVLLLVLLCLEARGHVEGTAALALGQRAVAAVRAEAVEPLAGRVDDDPVAMGLSTRGHAEEHVALLVIEPVERAIATPPRRRERNHVRRHGRRLATQQLELAQGGDGFDGLRALEGRRPAARGR